MAAIAGREARIREITNQAIEPVPDSLEEKLDDGGRTPDEFARADCEPDRSPRGEGAIGRAGREVHAGSG